MKTLFTPQIFTANGFAKESFLEGKRALDIGCGGKKLPGAVGIDMLDLPGVDVVHDLSVFPWPFKDSEFDLVFANHYMEHCNDMVKSMEEIYRILRPGGQVVIQVPYFRCRDAFTDPTHKHYCTAETLDYFIEDTHLFTYRYSNARFRKLGFWYGWPRASKNPLRQLFKSYIEKHTAWYDQYLSLLIPTECITWELEAVK